MDNGIATWHTDLRGKVVAQYDFAHNDRVAEDQTGHGTHVAGIASAVTGNGQGIAGACPNCTLIAAKFMDATGSGYTSDEVEAIIWAANVGAKVINMSFGGYGWAASEYNAVNYAYNRGAVLVASAGNSGSSALHYPSAHSNVMAVSATDSYDRRISWSNYGSWVDVAAPGRYILSTVPYGAGYEAWSGTSMSSPEVAGLAGLLAAQGRTNAQIRNRILYTARDLGPAGRDIYYGMGRIDAARAVQ